MTSCNAKAGQLHSPHLIKLLAASAVANQRPSPCMQISPEMLNETDIVPEQQIGFVREHALQLCAIRPDANRIPSGLCKGRDTFLTVVCYLIKKRMETFFSVWGSDLS